VSGIPGLYVFRLEFVGLVLSLFIISYMSRHEKRRTRGILWIVFYCGWLELDVITMFVDLGG